MADPLDARMAFLMEADRLKSVDRATTLLDQSRAENSAEHSWHGALAALVWLAGHPPDVQDRAIAMLLLHDLVEIDAGDQPIHLPHDIAALARAEEIAANRLFGLLPPDQGQVFHALWTEFEARETPAARAAKAVDYALPVLMALAARPQRPDHVDIARENLSTGRARFVAEELPELFAHLDAALTTQGDMAARCAFLIECDQLKSVIRATRIAHGSRFENSAEHSWHLALFALVLAGHASSDTDVATVVRMLLLHDIVEIDAGDNPVFGSINAQQIEAQEQQAADRLFGLLPDLQGQGLRSLWETFEANDTAEARFAKSLDRFQPPNLNIANGGGSWRDYSVTWDIFETRVGRKIAAGAPDLWEWIAPRVRAVLGNIP